MIITITVKMISEIYFIFDKILLLPFLNKVNIYINKYLYVK